MNKDIGVFVEDNDAKLEQMREFFMNEEAKKKLNAPQEKSAAKEV